MTSSNGHKTNQQVGTTVLIVMMEVDEADDEVFNKWYNEEHLPERISIPGYISARRFMLDPEDGQANGVLRYLCIWELENDSPLQSQLYKDQNAKPTPTKEANAVIKQRARGLYKQVFPASGVFDDRAGYTYPDGVRIGA
jgi:hypothetical protein